MPPVPPSPATPAADRHPTPRGVYLAGPSGFFAAGLQWHNQVVVPAVAAAGLVPKDPWAGPSPITEVLESMEYGAPRRAALHAANLAQGRIDLAMIDESEAILASLDGQDVDSGTALEIGYGFARGVLIVGLRTDIRRCSDNEGCTVNLMIETCIEDSGGILTDSLDTAVRFLADRLAPDRPRA
jgi:nucleoside 2-deoxyribosyltransferase